MDKIKHHSNRAGSGFSQLLRDNPTPALLSALGITWLIGSGLRSRQASRSERRRYESSTPYDAELRSRHALYEAGMESQGSAYPPPSQYQYGEGEQSGRYQQQGGSEAMRESAQAYGEQAKQKAGEYGEQTRQKASEYGEQARQYGEQAKRKAGEYGEQAKQRASEIGHQMREQASETGERIREGSQQVSEKARDMFEQHPLSVSLGMIAAGLALGMLLPGTRKEDEMLGQQRDQLFHRAKDYGKDIAERGQVVAERTAEAAKEAATEAASEEGLTGEQTDTGGEAETQARPGGSESQS